MRLSVILLLFAASVGLTGCDRALPPKEQAEGDGAAKPGAANNRADRDLVSASGLTATLSYADAGSPAPDVDFTGADGRTVRLSQFTGRPMLLNVWATWCAPCKAEMPTLDALAAKRAGQMSVVVVSQDLKGRQPVQAFFDSRQIRNLEPYIDPQNRILAAFGNQLPLPATILYDSNGREVWRVIGGAEWNDEEISSLLDEAS